MSCGLHCVILFILYFIALSKASISTVAATTSTFVSEHEKSIESTCPSNAGDQCKGNDYCSGQHRTGATCIDGYCRCPDIVDRNPCTCLAQVGSCGIEKGAGIRVGTPTYDGSSVITYSCISGIRSRYEVHVISNYESNGQHGIGQTRTTGITVVNFNVHGNSTIPLALVFASYEPVNWILYVPSGVVIETVLLTSYYIDDSNVTYSPGKVHNFEKLTNQEVPYGYGEDTGGGNIVDMLKAVVNRFGSVYSFSGSYRADMWTLNINRDNTSIVTPSHTIHTETILPTTSSSSSNFLSSRSTFSSKGIVTSEIPAESSSSPSDNTDSNQLIIIISASMGGVIILGIFTIVILSVMVIVIKKQKRGGIDTPTRPNANVQDERYQYRTSNPYYEECVDMKRNFSYGVVNAHQSGKIVLKPNPAYQPTVSIHRGNENVTMDAINGGYETLTPVPQEYILPVSSLGVSTTQKHY